MERVVESGLEANVPAPEVVAQADRNTREWKQDNPRRLDQSVQSQLKSKARYRAMWLLAVIAVVCVAIALGAGLGVGLTAQHKSSSSM